MDQATKDEMKAIVHTEITPLAGTVAKLDDKVSSMQDDVHEIKTGVGSLLTSMDRLLKNTETEEQERTTSHKQLERRVATLEKARSGA